MSDCITANGYTIFQLLLTCLSGLLFTVCFHFQAPQCEHAFCSSCIHEWLTRQQTCPVDRNSITPNQLQPVPRILRNLLSRLYIACDNASFGCTAIVKLDLLQSHLQVIMQLIPPQGVADCPCALNLYMNTSGAEWQYLLPGTEVHLPISMFFRLRGTLATDLPIGDVLKKPQM